MYVRRFQACLFLGVGENNNLTAIPREGVVSPFAGVRKAVGSF